MPIAAPHPSLFVSFGVAALVVWRLYRRIRRNIGRQTFSSKRAWTTLTVFPIIVALLMLGSLVQPLNLSLLIAGAALGSALGVWGLRLTKFERTSHGLFYTPNAHIGIVLSMLFIGRVVYRLMQIWLLVGSGHASSADFVRSPITLAIFGTMAGYYGVYAAGLLRWRRRVDTVSLA